MRTAPVFAASLLLACSVDTDGFPAVMTGAASVSASATAGDGTASDSDAGDGTQSSDGSGAGSASSGTADTASDGVDATGPGDASSTAADATATATATATDDTAGTTDGAACTGAPLDAQLDVPPLCAPTCTNIGFNGGDCLGSEICRLKDSVTAVCETCEACGNLNAFCGATVDCDILFTCFMGQCTAMCDFDTPQTCGIPAACTDVGHPTHGVCDPNF